MANAGLLLRTAFAPAVWGTTYLVTSEFLVVDHPMWNGLLRALPAGLLLLAVRPGLPRGSWWWRALVLGGLNVGGFFALLFISAALLPGGVAATLGATQVLLVIGLAAVLLGESVRLSQVLVALAGIGGVALLVLQGATTLDPLGVAAGLGTAAFLGLGLVLTRRWGLPPGVDGLTATAWQLLGGSVVLVPLAIGLEGAPPRLDWQALAGLAWLATIGGALAYAFFLTGVRRLPPAASSIITLISPLVATLLGWGFLHQTLTPLQVIGAVLVLGSVVVGQRLAVRSAQPSFAHRPPETGKERFTSSGLL